MRRALHTILPLLVVLLATPPARAQLGWSLPSFDTAQAIGRDAVNRQITLEILRRENRAGQAPRQATAQPRPAAPFTARFTPRPEITRQTIAQIVQQARARDAAGGAEIERGLARMDVFATFRQAMGPYPLRPDDAADAMTAYWVISWAMANRLRPGGPLPTPPQVMLVRNQVAAGMARAEVARFTEPQRQQLAVEAMVNYLIIHSFWMDRQPGWESRFARISDEQQRVFQGFGADLRGLSITDQGFERR